MTDIIQTTLQMRKSELEEGEAICPREQNEDKTQSCAVSKNMI